MATTLDEALLTRGATQDSATRTFRQNQLLGGVVVLACWAAWLRMGGQWFEPGFNPSGLVTMGGALCFGLHRCWATRQEAAPPSTGWLIICAAFLASYGLLYGVTPRVVTSTIAVMATATVLLAILPRAERRDSWGLLPWMLASLPLGVAVNLYFGYPLRVGVGWLASAILPGAVVPLGTGLSDGTHTVFVDAPCSGIQMLRIAVLLAGIVAVMYRLRLRSSLALVVTAIILSMLGNTVRVCVLFLLTRRGDMSEAFHTWSGVAIFTGCALALVGAGLVFARLKGMDSAADLSLDGRCPSTKTRFARMVLLLATALASLTPLSVAEVAHKGGESLPWPASIEGEALEIGPPDPALAAYRSAFLGTMVQGRLQPSGRLVLLRQCVEPTLTMHTSENCYVVAGFRCAALPALRDAQGHLWSRFSAEHPDGRSYLVKQCFFSVEQGDLKDTNHLEDWTVGYPSWPDSSSWYWAAARPGAKIGHTLAVTIAEKHLE